MHTRSKSAGPPRVREVAFGSAAPREMSYLVNIPRQYRFYDRKIVQYDKSDFIKPDYQSIFAQYTTPSNTGLFCRSTVYRDSARGRQAKSPYPPQPRPHSAAPVRAALRNQSQSERKSRVRRSSSTGSIKDKAPPAKARAPRPPPAERQARSRDRPTRSSSRPEKKQEAPKKNKIGARRAAAAAGATAAAATAATAAAVAKTESVDDTASEALNQTNALPNDSHAESRVPDVTSPSKEIDLPVPMQDTVDNISQQFPLEQQQPPENMEAEQQHDDGAMGQTAEPEVMNGAAKDWYGHEQQELVSPDIPVMSAMNQSVVLDEGQQIEDLAVEVQETVRSEDDSQVPVDSALGDDMSSPLGAETLTGDYDSDLAAQRSSGDEQYGYGRPGDSDTVEEVAHQMYGQEYVEAVTPAADMQFENQPELTPQPDEDQFAQPEMPEDEPQGVLASAAGFASDAFHKVEDAVGDAVENVQEFVEDVKEDIMGHGEDQPADDSGYPADQSMLDESRQEIVSEDHIQPEFHADAERVASGDFGFEQEVDETVAVMSAADTVQAVSNAADEVPMTTDSVEEPMLLQKDFEELGDAAVAMEQEVGEAAENVEQQIGDSAEEMESAMQRYTDTFNQYSSDAFQGGQEQLQDEAGEYLDQAGEDVQQEIHDFQRNVKDSADHFQEEAEALADDVHHGVDAGIEHTESRDFRQEVEDVVDDYRQEADSFQLETEAAVDNVQQAADDFADDIRQEAESVADDVNQDLQSAAQQAEDVADDFRQNMELAQDDFRDKVEDAVDEFRQEADHAEDNFSERQEEFKQSLDDAADGFQQDAAAAADDLHQELEDIQDQVADATAEQTDELSYEAEQALDHMQESDEAVEEPKNILESAAGFATDAFHKVEGAVGDAVENVQDFVEDVKEDIMGHGEDQPADDVQQNEHDATNDFEVGIKHTIEVEGDIPADEIIVQQTVTFEEAAPEPCDDGTPGGLDVVYGGQSMTSSVAVDFDESSTESHNIDAIRSDVEAAEEETFGEAETPLQEDVPLPGEEEVEQPQTVLESAAAMASDAFHKVEDAVDGAVDAAQDFVEDVKDKVLGSDEEFQDHARDTKTPDIVIDEPSIAESESIEAAEVNSSEDLGSSDGRPHAPDQEQEGRSEGEMSSAPEDPLASPGYDSQDQSLGEYLQEQVEEAQDSAHAVIGEAEDAASGTVDEAEAAIRHVEDTAEAAFDQAREEAEHFGEGAAASMQEDVEAAVEEPESKGFLESAAGFASDAFHKVEEAVGDAVENVQDFVQDVKEDFGEEAAAGEASASELQAELDLGMDNVAAEVDQSLDQEQRDVEGVVDEFTVETSEEFDEMNQTVEDVSAQLDHARDTATENLSNAADDYIQVTNEVQHDAGEALEAASEQFNAGLDDVQQAVTDSADDMQQRFDAGLDDVQQQFDAGLDDVTEAAGDIQRTDLDDSGTALEETADAPQSFLGAAAGFASDAFHKVEDAVGDAVENVQDFVEDVKEDIMGHGDDDLDAQEGLAAKHRSSIPDDDEFASTENGSVEAASPVETSQTGPGEESDADGLSTIQEDRETLPPSSPDVPRKPTVEEPLTPTHHITTEDAPMSTGSSPVPTMEDGGMIPVIGTGYQGSTIVNGHNDDPNGNPSQPPFDTGDHDPFLNKQQVLAEPHDSAL